MGFRKLGLASQLLLVVTLALFVAQAINLVIIFNERRELSLTRSVEPAVARLLIAQARDDLSDRPAARRFPFLREMGERLRRDGPPEMASNLRNGAMERAIAQRLQDAGMPALEVRVFAREGRDLGGRNLRDRDSLIVFAHFADAGWRVTRTRAPPPALPVLGFLTVQTAVIFVITLIPLLVFGRRAGRSLAALGSAARAYRGSGDPEPVPAEGPADVRALIEAFNDMRHRISAMIAEKDQMLGAIGHDLRTPLSALRIRAESVPDDDDREAMIESIEELHAQLEDILAFAKISRTHAERTDTDLRALAESVVDAAATRGLAAELEDGPPLSLPAHKAALRRALQNLVDNAAIYGHRAQVSIAVDQGEAVLRVEDDGPGIAAHDLQRAAEPFVRLESSRNRATGGSGLGLAIARAAAELHGGRLQLSNRAEGGLRAEMRLPT